MKRYLVFGVLGLFAFGSAAACGSGSQGPQGPQGEPGEAGPPGPPGESVDGGGTTPSISAVIPEHTFLARNAEVTVSGYATNWSATSKPTVDFGANIKVTNVIVASATSLVVDITTDGKAAVGLRDVKVTDAKGTETYAKAFNVLSPLSVSFQGVTAQGGIMLATIRNLDIENPFDTTSSTDPNTGATTYPNLAINLPAGVMNQGFYSFDPSAGFAAGTPTATEIPLVLTIDVNAKAGMTDLDVVSGPPSADGGVGAGQVDFPMPGGMNVQARTATALTSGTAASATIANAGDTALFSLTPASSAMTILDWTSTPSSTYASISLLPDPGSWGANFANLLSQASPETVVYSSSKAVYGVYWDPSGTTGSISVTSTATAAGGNAAASASDGTKATAVAASALPFVLTNGDLSTGGDWVKVTLPTGQTSLRVQTIGDFYTDAVVTLLQSDGTTQVGNPAETGTLVDTTFTGLTAGATYYVTFTQGQMSFFSNSDYSAVIR